MSVGITDAMTCSWKHKLPRGNRGRACALLRTSCQPEAGFRVSGLASESQGWLPSLTVGFRVSRLASESQERGPLLPGATPGSSAPRRLQLRGAELERSGARSSAPRSGAARSGARSSAPAPLLGGSPPRNLQNEPGALPAPTSRRVRAPGLFRLLSGTHEGEQSLFQPCARTLRPSKGALSREGARACVRDTELAEVRKILRSSFISPTRSPGAVL